MDNKLENQGKQLTKNLINVLDENTIILCIGTDRAIFDAYGPLVGTKLSERLCPLKIYGTLENPIHAKNLEKTVKEIKRNYPNSKILAIDACKGDKDEKKIIFKSESISPGAALNKNLSAIGDNSILGITFSQDYFFTEFDTGFSCTRLFEISEMANITADSIMLAINLLNIKIAI